MMMTVEFLNRHILIDISIRNKKLKNRLGHPSRNVVILIVMPSEYQYDHNYKYESVTKSDFF